LTAALASAVPELDSTSINKLTDDMQSFVFDGAVRVCACPSVGSDGVTHSAGLKYTRATFG